MSQKILVAGSGKSGIAASRMALDTEHEVILYDSNEALDAEAVRGQFKEDETIEVLLGELTKEALKDVELCVISPGIPLDAPFVEVLKACEVPIWSEIQLAYHYARGKLAAITGTNGKTTTTSLVGEIMSAYYKEVFVVGNIGTPYTSVALDTKDESVIVAEISSFQLETIQDFRPQVSAVLNITPDHLDRHGTVEVYARTKESIGKNQTGDQVMVLNYEDPVTRNMAERANARVVFFSLDHELEEGVYFKDGSFMLAENKTVQTICTEADINLLGGHNYENILAAIAVSHYMGVPAEQIRKGVSGFKGVEHRIEYVDTIKDVAYYNDSKGTNTDAAIKGIKAMNRPTFLIGGGYDKKAEYDDWIEAFDGKVKELILLGATAEKIGKTAEAHGFSRIVYVDTLEEAVEYASKHAVSGDAVLLSPACASWGMFPNYEVRGDRFKEYVNKLKER